MTDEKTTEEVKPDESLPQLVDRLEKANKEAKEIVAEQKALAARNLIGGKSMAGEQIDYIPKEDSPKEYKDKVLKGEIKYN